jgi:ribonuclease P/MRP protein subunit RPP40
VATKSGDAGNPFYVIFFYFAKAFDKVPREREWLTGRQQRVVLNGQSSDWEEVLSGVPQGSVLGPPLFTIYIDDIGDIVRFIEILRKFADDRKLGNTVATPEDRWRLELALTKLCEWARTWGMKFNIRKCG